MANYQVVVIGGGPGGYTAAIRCTQLGLKTAVVEKNELGGACLNVGCIPSKALLDTTELFAQLKEAKTHGILLPAESVRVDLARMMERKGEIVKKMTEGVAFLLKSNRVDVYKGVARWDNRHTITVEKSGAPAEAVTADKVILATGSAPVPLPFRPFDHERIVDSTDALSFKETPRRLLIVGAGAIGLELGSVWARLGASVTVVEMMEQILPGTDSYAANRLTQLLKKQGLSFLLPARLTAIDESGKELKIKVEGKDGLTELACDRLLVAIGRKPYLEGFGLPAEIKTDPRTGRVEVDENFQTSAAGVYAIGDLIRGPMLAHKAEDEGIAAAEIIAGGAGLVNYHALPAVVYTRPEYASVGKSEDELKASGVEFRRGVFQFGANGRALASENREGFVKILTDKKTDRVLGAQIVGPWASDLITELATVMEFDGTAEDIARTSHAHPSLSEVVREAALDAAGRPLNAAPKQAL